MITDTRPLSEAPRRNDTDYDTFELIADEFAISRRRVADEMRRVTIIAAVVMGGSVGLILLTIAIVGGRP